VYSVAVSPNGQLVAAAGLDRKVFLWDFHSGQLVRTLTGHKDDIYRVEFNPAGTRLVTAGYAGWVHFWDPGRENPLAGQKLNGVMYSATFAPHGKQVAVMGQDTKVYLVDVPAEAQ
jgi:WD40 repeat protein